MSVQRLSPIRRHSVGHYRLENLGISVLRYALVLILLYFGSFKFTPTEAKAIQPLLEHSPLMSWLYSVLSVSGVSGLIGVAELTIAGLILSRT